MKVICPGCQKSFNVKDEFAGRSGKCPACGAVLTIPEKPATEAPGAPPRPVAEGVTVCETHENERIIARCSVCGRGVCRMCRDEFGYYCSQACREKGGRRSLAPSEQEEQRQVADFATKLSRWIAIAKWRVLPVVAALVLILVVYKLTDDRGEQIWKFVPTGDVAISPITLAGETVLAGCHRTLRAIDAGSGKELWAFEAEGDVSGWGPLDAGEGLCVVRDEARLYCLDAAKGKLLWKHPVAGEITWGPAAGAGVVVTVCDLYREPTQEERDDAKAMSLTGRSWVDPTRLPALRERAAASGTDLRSGKELWTVRLAKDSLCRGFALAGKKLYLCWDEPGEKGDRSFLALFDPASGKEQWRRTLGAVEGTGEPPGALLRGLGQLRSAGGDPARAAALFGGMMRAALAEIAGGSGNALVPTGKGVLVTSSDGLANYSSGGKRLWKSSPGSPSGAPVVAGSRIYYPSTQGVDCLKLADGKKLWSAATGAPASPPVVEGGLLLVSTRRTETVKGLQPKATIRLPQPKAKGVEDIQKMMDPAAAQFGPGEVTINVLSAFDAATGKPAWTTDGAGGKILCQGKCIFTVNTRSKFVLMDATSASISEVTAVRARNGKILWHYEPGGSVGSLCATNRALIISSGIVAMHTSAITSGRRSVTDSAITALSLTH
ncbi:MAG: outer membrane protein assembly factor BamB family protein [Planctomycetota bacterium]